MITLRSANDRGKADFGWLDSRHSFSFGSYYDPRQRGFRALRVINEDKVAPGAGFGEHGHKDMEIISYVLDGALAHRDSMGNGAVLRPGEVQIMSAGTGIMHSEFNHETGSQTHFLQIWIEPDRTGLQPGYQQRAFPAEERQGRLRPVVSQDGREDSLIIHADAVLYASLLAPGDRVVHPLGAGRGAWLQLARGRVRLGDSELGPGDGAAIEAVDEIAITAITAAELLLHDLG